MPLIVIEGVDSSGKATQAERLYLKLMYEGFKTRKISFPNYKSEASALVKMYLSGSFGQHAQDVSPYAASTFYAVDRFASYKQYWKKFLDGGGTIVSDRYTTSNLIHQGAKIEDEEEKRKYLDWVTDFEYNKMGLPKPDVVVFLDVPPEVSIKLMKERANKITGRKEKDIHEKDDEYMINSYHNAAQIAKSYDWLIVSCADGDELRPIEDISDEIREKIGAKLNIAQL